MADQTTKIPKGWKMTTLGEVVEFQRGFDLPTQDRTKGKYPLIASTGIDGFVNEYKVQSPGVVTGRSGSLGKVLFVKENFWPLNTTLWIKDFKCNDEKFIYYWLLNFPFEKYNAGTGVPTLNRNHIHQVEVMIPIKIEEQRAIAAVLSSLDDKIELLREQNKTLEATAQAIFKEWFVRFNFPNEHGEPYATAGGTMIDSELGPIPEGWRVGTVNDFISRETISYRCDQDDLSPKGKTPVFDQGTNGLYGYTEREPDFQASKENPVILFTNHTCNMWFVNYPFCAIQNVIPFRGNFGYDTFFVYYMTLGRVSFIEYKGHWPDFEQKEYVIPTAKIANEFAEFVKPLQYKIWNNNSQIQTLSTLRDTLLPKLMKGEIRVEGFRE
jgi:type I restriction enzyme S subunit